ncbi:MAG: hypothetical protein WCV55_03070 [Candidatus Paceibacterota bacterium]
MRNDIREKLQAELNKKIEGEPQVVYILSRVRKMLEIDGKEKETKYNKLKFYCDWALHPAINNVGAVRDILDGIVARRAEVGADLTMKFETFHHEFKRFLKEYGISTIFYDSDENRFYLEMYLSQIYADTPLIIDRKIKVSWFGQAGERSFGGSFKVENLTKPSARDTSDLIKYNY